MLDACMHGDAILSMCFYTSMIERRLEKVMATTALTKRDLYVCPKALVADHKTDTEHR